MMENIISKELLSEVLGSKVTRIEYKKDNYTIGVNCIRIHYATSIYFQDINIYELAHKCKEWAYEKKHYLIESRFSLGCSGVSQVAKNGLSEYEEIFHENSEAEAIFKACQLILDNKVKK